MGDAVLLLGDVSFQDMEVPEAISFGGKQRLATQNVIGGGRVVEALGVDDGEISFEGIFSGADAALRAQMLDIARAQGEQLPMLWRGFYYNVVIADFIAEYRKPNLIPFSVRCVVVNDPQADGARFDVRASDLVASDIAAALNLSVQAGFPAGLMMAQNVAALGAVQTSIGAGLNASGAVLDEAAATLNGAITPVIGIKALGQMSESAGRLAGISGMAGYVNRAVLNLGFAL